MPFTSVDAEMHRFGQGKLHSGKGGPVVTDPKQAIAIALSEKRRSGGKAQEKLDETRETIKSAAARRAHKQKQKR
jgi:hypothetical protein